ncbi:MAG: choice-of-anchor D domain-containing protein [Bacteroidales bacterium]|nr:choice-of-anchor D domain-containing protein [Bacteroidales bacterium]
MKKLLLLSTILFSALVMIAPINISAQPGIFVNSYYLDYGDIAFGETYTTYITIWNLGDGILEINDITFSNDDFSAAATSLNITAGTYENVDVVFTPSAVAVYNETMMVFSNDTANPVNVSPITANVIIPAPEYLVADVQGNDVELSWGNDGPESSWLGYDNGIANASLGISQAGSFRIAARWPASALNDFIGNTISRVAFFPTGEFTGYTAKIWKGQNAGTLVYEQIATDLSYNEWNELQFEVQVEIEPNEEYWVGFELTQYNSFDGSAAFDIGPAVAGFGDMVNLGSDWFAATYAGFDYNWLIRVMLLDQENPESLVVLGLPEEPLQPSEAELVESTEEILFPATTNIQLLNLDLLGYNIYRDGSLLYPEPLNDGLFVDSNVDPGVYVYGVTAVFDVGESSPVERTVQVGAPGLLIDPAFISETLEGGEVWTMLLTLSNTGASDLDWQVNELPFWLSLSSNSGTISAGDSATNITLTVNTTGMGTSYELLLPFVTNNLNNPVTNLPVIINLEWTVLLLANPSSLDFGMQGVGQMSLSEVEITNLSDALIMLFSGQTGTDDFASYMPTWSIPAGESISVTVSFTPSAPGDFLDTLSIEYFGYQGTGELKVPMQGEGVIMPPSNLTASLDENIVTLNWLPPGASPDVLRFGNGEPFSSIATSNGTYELAARFMPFELMPYNNKQLDQVGFYLTGNNADFTLKVYSGEFADSALISLPLNNLVADQWNDIALPFPIAIAGLDYLWIGYEMEVEGLEYNAGVDGGPAIPGSGDLLRINGSEWTTLYAYGFSKNWNIRGLVSDAINGDSLVLQAGQSATLPENLNLIGYHVYRDSMQLTTNPISELSFTDTIEEGETYLYGVTAVFSYGESSPASNVVGIPAALTMPAGWEFTPTAMPHNIHIPEAIQQIGMSLSPGDMIGVFYNDYGVDKCAGVIQWNANHAVLTAYGNDPDTPVKDGFEFNEPIQWKVYMQQTSATANIVATYDHNMPHFEGLFKMLGLSMVESLELGTVGVEDVFARNTGVNIYPNPSNGQVTLSGISGGDQVNVYDNSGRLILSRYSEQSFMQLNINQHGLYLVEILGQQEVERKKLIIQ